MSSYIYGDWDKLDKILHNLANDEPEFDQVVLEVGEEIANKIRQMIDSQELDLAPLKREYLAQKTSEGYDSRILIRTHSFVESIQITDIEDRGDGMMVFIGVENGTTETGLSMQELADFIEFGTSKQPARMPFHKAWAMMQSEIKEIITEKIMSILESDLS